jgi:hypothetical protein
VPRSLKSKLNHVVGNFGEVEFILPHVFLPPRFKEISEDRNMILFLDIDQVMHVRWEGALQDSHHPLTPGACRRLFRECVRNMRKYRKDLDAFSRFVDKTAEEPFWDPRVSSLSKPRPEKPAEAIKDPEPEEIIAVVDNTGKLVEGTFSDLSESGGESPMPFGW